MAISKVTYAGNTLIDLTGDTVTPENLLSGATAHAANGEEITGIVEDKKGELEAQIADLRNQIAANTSAIATKSDSTVTDQLAKNTAQIETAGTATSAHSAGEYVMISNALYKVAASVAKGDTWTIGTNVTAANIGSEISSLKSDLANKLYPVGSIYLSVNATNPSELFGGTWEQLKDRFLLAAGDSYAAGSTGGEATHTLSVDEMPKHRHSSDSYLNGYSNSGIVEQDRYCTWVNSGTKDNNEPNWGESGPIKTSWVGGSQPHNNMPPYLAVYMWKRIA